MAIAGAGVTRALLFAPPPHVVRPDQLALILPRWTTPTGAPSLDEGRTSVADLADILASTHAFRDVAGYAALEVALGPPEDGEVGQAAFFTPAFFRVLGAAPVLGRVPDSTAAYEVVLGDAYWRRAYGGDPRVVGRRAVVGGRPYRVAGVAPPRFGGIERSPVDVWLPVQAAADMLFGGVGPDWRFDPWLTAVGRLRPGRSTQSATAEVAATLQRGFERYVGGATGGATVGAELQPVRDRRLQVVGRAGDVSKLVLWLALAVLGVACSNALHLLLVRTIERQQELQVRSALGASPRTLVAAAWAESGLLVAAGAAAAWPLALLISRALMRQLAPSGEPDAVPVDGVVAGTAVTLVLASWVVGTAWPLAVVLRRGQFSEIRRGAGTESRTSSLLRGGVLAAQLATSCVLLVLAGVALRGFRDLVGTPLGFAPDDVLVAQVAVRDGDLRRMLPAVVDALRARPGVAAVAAAGQAPFTGGPWWPVRVGAVGAGGGGAPSRAATPVPVNAVSPAYFAALGQRVLRGRTFDATDRGTSVVVNAQFARGALGGLDAIGRCVFVDIPERPVDSGAGAGSASTGTTGRPSSPQCRLVIGVVADARVASIRELRTPEVYVPLGYGFGLARATILLRSANPSAAQEVRRVIADRVPSLASVRVRPYAELIAPLTAAARAAAWLFGALGAVALALTVLGVFGTASYAVARRAREIAIRRALGASAPRVLAAVLGRQGPALAAGMAVGVLASVLAARAARSLLGVQSDVLRSYAAAIVAVACGVLAACVVPAQRAAASKVSDLVRDAE